MLLAHLFWNDDSSVIDCGNHSLEYLTLLLQKSPMESVEKSFIAMYFGVSLVEIKNLL